LRHQRNGLFGLDARHELDEWLADKREDNKAQHIEDEMDRVDIRAPFGELLEQYRIGKVCLCLYHGGKFIRVSSDFPQHEQRDVRIGQQGVDVMLSDLFYLFLD